MAVGEITGSLLTISEGNARVGEVLAKTGEWNGLSMEQ